MSPVPRLAYRLPLPRGGYWREVLNTNSHYYGGSGVGNLGGEKSPRRSKACSKPIAFRRWAAQPFDERLDLLRAPGLADRDQGDFSRVPASESGDGGDLVDDSPAAGF